MRDEVILDLVGSFLQVFAVMIALPIIIGLYFGESIYILSGFVVSSVACLVIGYAVKVSSGGGDPTISEAIFATVLGWTLAILFGAIPLLTSTGIVNAIFESAAGLTTTGITMFLVPEQLPKSLLFWRGFMQWIGGLGILTFFVAVIRESGGVARRLFSAEAHKTDSGSIRPSLKKSVTDLWRVYGFLTFLFASVYIGLGMSPFNSFMHAFSAISTGGFSTVGASIGGFNSVGIEAATTLFMFLGGVNFVLLYRFLRTDYRPLFQNSEFKLYLKLTVLLGLLVAWELFTEGGSLFYAVRNGFFQSTAVMSSTGYGTISLMGLSAAIQAFIIGSMFVGGSLGSTAGGYKVFRLKAMLELLKTRLRSYSLPESAINEVKIDREIVDDDAIRTISVLLFVWITIIFLGSVPVMVIEGISFNAALSGAVSSASNMGPVFMSGESMVGMSPVSKMLWVFLMIAGRLEMLPVLAIFNREIFKDSK